MDTKALFSRVQTLWREEALPALSEFITIPNISPEFDPQWKAHGHMNRAAELLATWARTQPIAGMTVEILELPGRTPIIYIEVPGTLSGNVFMYGHLDKQPAFTGWKEGRDPFKPSLEGDKLYGRGAVDDGYALFAALTSLRVLEERGIAHPRCSILIEGSEESGSPDLPAYVEHLETRIGIPDLVICLDSACGNYEQMWMTDSIRGLISGELKVEILSEGVHSGHASGIVPSTFRIMRQLLSRIENEETGEILLSSLHVPLETQYEKARQTATILGEAIHTEFPFVEGAMPVTSDPTEMILNRNWRPALSVIGAEGFPAFEISGNVLRPYTTLKLSMRIPAGVDAKASLEEMKNILEAESPYGARVTFTPSQPGVGWEAPILSEKLEKSIADASEIFFGKTNLTTGIGGSIPFMIMLGKKFPKTQFIVTGIAGPESNPHGPNEFLHLPTVERLTACIAKIVSEI